MKYNNMYFSFDSFRARLIKYLDLSPSDFDDGLAAWIKQNGEYAVSKNNYLTSLYISLSDKLATSAANKHEQFLKQRFIYGELYAYKCYHDEDCNEILRMMNYCDLQLARSENIKVEAVIRSGKCCPECDRQNGRILSIEQALLLQPIPHPGCTNEEGCICSYVFQSVRDVNNKFIKNETA